MTKYPDWYKRWKKSMMPPFQRWLDCHPEAERIFADAGEQGIENCWEAVKLGLPSRCTTGLWCSHWTSLEKIVKVGEVNDE